MAAADPCREADGKQGRGLGLREVVDVVVLAHHVAVAHAVGQLVRAAVEPEDHRPLRRGEPRLEIRFVDHPRRSAVRDVQELPAVAADRHVRDDVELLARVGERTLERAVVAGCQQQLAGQATGAQEQRKSRKRPVHGTRCEIAPVESVQLVDNGSTPWVMATNSATCARPRAASAGHSKCRARCSAAAAGPGTVVEAPMSGPSTDTSREALTARAISP